MQHLENDMEELFKRAGENYSPQKGKGDWESIAKRIADKSTSPTAIEPAGNSSNKKIIALFLSFFILSASFFAIVNTTSTSPSASKQNQRQKSANNSPHKLESKNDNGDLQPADVTKDLASAKKLKGKDGVKMIGPTNHNAAEGKAGIGLVAHYSAIAIQDLHKKTWKNDLVNDNVHNRKTDLPGDRERGVKSDNPLSATIKPGEIISEKDKSGIVISKEGDVTSVKKRHKAAATTVQKNKGFYIGLIAAMDFSKVKSALYHNTGFGAGLIAGYRVSKKLSLETGVILNKKAYNSEGQYFSLAKLAMPSGMSINNVESRSTLIEIPLKVKYDFIRKRSSAFFIAAGVSAYIMTKEKNMYNVTVNGNQEKMAGVYEKNSYGIPAVAGISAGYERRVSGKIDIRLEPFIKVPLRGIGVGSLPVTSAGFQVGITRRLQ